MSEEFRLKNINETRNYLLEEIKQNEFRSKKCKKFCIALSYIEHNHWMYFSFGFVFVAWYYYRNYEFCNRIKNFCNSCRN